MNEIRIKALQLGLASLPVDEADRDSIRQVDASTEFYTFIESKISPEAYAECEDFGAHATLEESIVKCLSKIGLNIHSCYETVGEGIRWQLSQLEKE